MKAIFFDFDGTLTVKKSNTWKDIWDMLGYDTGKDSVYMNQYNDYLNGKYSYQKWCDLTCAKWVEANATMDIVNKSVSKVTFVDGFEKTMKYLKSKGYDLHIISGNIGDIINSALGKNKAYFTSVTANHFVWDKHGKLKAIKGTEYDYEGKAKYISKIIKKYHYDPKDVLFVGNSNNDEWAYLSGCNTLCINPDKISTTDPKVWNSIIEQVTNLDQVAKHFESINNKKVG